jgi:enoyl-CoA hydratase
MAPEYVSIEPHGAVTLFRLNRPPANTIDLEIARQFEAVFERAMKDAPAAIVLTGTGPFFCGGLDLKVVPGYSRQEQRSLVDKLNRLMARLYACPIPVVGAINGHAMAGGFMLALTTDYRIGPISTASFGLTEARVGIPFPGVPLIVLQAELAPQDARYSTLYARHFGPEEAQARGVLDELRPPDAVLDRALEVAHDMASMPADAYRRIKSQVREAAIDRIEALIAAGTDPMLDAWLSPEAHDASSAFLRSPKG